METYFISSSENETIKINLPWANVSSKTLSVGLKEFSFDNFIENIKKDFTITIVEPHAKKIDKVLLTISLESGHYELDDILNMIAMKLDDKFKKTIRFLFNKATSKIYVENTTNNVIHLSDTVSDFFCLPKVIDPQSFIKSSKIINLTKSNTLFVRVKYISNGIHFNQNISGGNKGGIVHTCAITNQYGQNKIDHVMNLPVFYEFTSDRLQTVEITITDEFNEIVNIQNIRMLLYFNTLK